MPDAAPPPGQPPAASPAQPRKKSQHRQRTKRITAHLTADEFNRVAEKVAAAGYSESAYARAVLLGDAGPRSQRRLPVDAQLLREVLAQLGRYGNNWNQVAYHLNTGKSIYENLPDIEAERGVVDELRRLVLKALGHDGTSPA